MLLQKFQLTEHIVVLISKLDNFWITVDSVLLNFNHIDLEQRLLKCFWELLTTISCDLNPFNWIEFKEITVEYYCSNLICVYIFLSLLLFYAYVCVFCCCFFLSFCFSIRQCADILSVPLLSSPPSIFLTPTTATLSPASFSRHRNQPLNPLRPSLIPSSSSAWFSHFIHHRLFAPYPSSYFSSPDIAFLTIIITHNMMRTTDNRNALCED